MSSTTWYYTCLNPSTSTYGWTLASGYKSLTTHTAPDPVPEEPTEPSEPELPDEPIVSVKSYKDVGMYYLDSISLNENKNEITIRGLLSISGIDNLVSTDLSYKLILTNQQDGTLITIDMDRWLDSSSHPFDASNIPGYKNDFSGAWFTKTFSFTGIPNGDYSLSIEAHTEQYYTSKILSNDNSISIDQRFMNENNSGIELRTNFLLKTLPLELFIRHSGLISSSAKASLDNAFIEYTKLDLSGTNLQIRGTAFNINGSYGANEEVKREIILENTTTFERYTFNICSITTGDGQVVLRIDDGKDKTRAWFDANIDISTLSKGTYAIYIHTVSGNGIDDYGELADSFIRTIDASSTVNDIQYSLQLNKDRRYRIELQIK